MIVAICTIGWQWLDLNIQDGRCGRGPETERAQNCPKTMMIFGKVLLTEDVIPSRFPSSSRFIAFLTKQTV